MGVELPAAKEVSRRLVRARFIDRSLRRAVAGCGEGVICWLWRRLSVHAWAAARKRAHPERGDQKRNSERHRNSDCGAEELEETGLETSFGVSLARRVHVPGKTPSTGAVRVYGRQGRSLLAVGSGPDALEEPEPNTQGFPRQRQAAARRPAAPRGGGEAAGTARPGAEAARGVQSRKSAGPAIWPSSKESPRPEGHSCNSAAPSLRPAPEPTL